MPPEPIPIIPPSGSSTSPVPEIIKLFSLSAIAIKASSLLKYLSVLQSFASSTAARVRLPACFSSLASSLSKRVRASADRTVVETTSVAQKEADIIRGQADGKRNAIFADAFGRDPEFFAFYRSLTAYEKSLNGDNATMIISPNSEFFDYLNSDSLNE